MSSSCAIAWQKCSRAVKIAAAASLSRSTRSENSLSNPNAQARRSPAAASHPFSPCVINSLLTAKSDANTGVPAAIDSTIFTGQQPCQVFLAVSANGATVNRTRANTEANSAGANGPCKSTRPSNRCRATRLSRSRAAAPCPL